MAKFSPGFRVLSFLLISLPFYVFWLGVATFCLSIPGLILKAVVPSIGLSWFLLIGLGLSGVVLIIVSWRIDSWLFPDSSEEGL